MYVACSCICVDNDPSWMGKEHDMKEDDDFIDVHPSELTSVRAVLNTLPLSLTTPQSSSTPSALVTNRITLRITETNMTWHPPPSATYSKKNKGTREHDH